MRYVKIVWIVLLAALLLAPAAPALASDGEPPGRVVFGEDFTLHDGEVLDGDLVVVGGSATLEEGSRVDGNVVVWGGDVEVAGEVDGDVVAFGGSVYLAETAEVDGDMAVFGGEVEQEEGAQVRGQQVVGPSAAFEMWPVPIPISFGPGAVFHGGPRMILGSLLMRVGRLVLLTLLMAGLAGLVAVLWPRPAVRVGEAAVRFVPLALGVGLLTMVAAAIVVVGLILTLCLSPAALLVALAVGIAALFGWLALGILIGERMIQKGINPFWSAALGAGLLTLLSGLLDLIPCVGWVVPFLIVCVGLGAVVLTRFGTVDYPPMAPPSLPILEEEGEREEEGEG